MHRFLHNTLQSLRQGLDLQLDQAAIELICQRLNHRWRLGILTPSVLIHWFLIQILHGNTALTHLALMANRTFTASAFCQARARLPRAVLEQLLQSLVATLGAATAQDDLWNGHRTLLIDGSTFSMPDTPELRQHFGQPGAQKPGCGFPVANILALFHAKTGLLAHVTAAPLRTHEMSRIDTIHPLIRSGDVLVGDRGLSSYAHLALLAERGAHGVFRVHQQQIVDFTPNRPGGVGQTGPGRPKSRWVRSLGPNDQVVEWFRPQKRPKWMSAERSAALPGSLLVRETRYQVVQAGYRTRQVTLVTTLVDAEKYSAKSLAELYEMRWRVEEDLRALKQTMKMDVLKCTTVDGVLKELIAYAIVYNLVRLVMVEAGHHQDVAADRISFIDALRWLIQARPGEKLPKLVVNPRREKRFEPRVRKRRPKQFRLMTKPRQYLRENLITQRLNA